MMVEKKKKYLLRLKMLTMTSHENKEETFREFACVTTEMVPSRGL